MSTSTTLDRTNQNPPHPFPSGPAAGLQATSLRAVLDDLDVGVLVCDEGGRLVHANAAARQELASRRVLQMDEQWLATADSAELFRLRRAVREAACQRRHQMLPLKGASGSLMVAIQPLRDRDPGTAPQAVLVLGRRHIVPELAMEMYSNLHALTSAEKRVLQGLVSGERVRDHADAHGVKECTVRAQVAHLRQKLSVKRVDDMLRGLAALPPIASALRFMNAP